MNYIICHTDSTARRNFSLASDIDAWKTMHPYDRIDYIFNETADMQTRTNELEWSFATYCTNYGLTPNMLHGLFTNPKGHICELIGMHTANKKYKFIIKDKQLDRRYKVTADYILKNWPSVKTVAHQTP